MTQTKRKSLAERSHGPSMSQQLLQGHASLRFASAQFQPHAARPLELAGGSASVAAAEEEDGGVRVPLNDAQKNAARKRQYISFNTRAHSDPPQQHSVSSIQEEPDLV